MNPAKLCVSDIVDIIPKSNTELFWPSIYKVEFQFH